MSEREELIDGQVYRWRWADPARDADNAPYRSYHCKSQIAHVKNGLLIDTFWFGFSSENALDRDMVTLTLLCDETWPQISSYQVHYYDPADVVDTRHSNNSHAPIYLRPGAQRSKATILETLTAREEKANSEIRMAEWSKQRINEARALVAEGRLDEVML